MRKITQVRQWPALHQQYDSSLGLNTVEESAYAVGRSFEDAVGLEIYGYKSAIGHKSVKSK
jgi:hypothetical protein